MATADVEALEEQIAAHPLGPTASAPPLFSAQAEAQTSQSGRLESNKRIPTFH
eukprot:SAG11_NODE_18539_length_488_cov_0.894602_1_plen_52_part_01